MDKILALKRPITEVSPMYARIYARLKEDQDKYEKPTDRAGRRNDGGPKQKSAVEEPTWKAHAKSLFVQDLANLLNRKGLKGAYDRLVLVASPQVLGLLRRRLHSEVLGKVVAEVNKTLTNHPLHKVEQVVRHSLQPKARLA